MVSLLDRSLMTQPVQLLLDPQCLKEMMNQVSLSEWKTLIVHSPFFQIIFFFKKIS